MENVFFFFLLLESLSLWPRLTRLSNNPNM